MNTKFGIKNFRVFDREGATFEIAPLTILTGCNSSGKSSMVKSQLLLSNFLKMIQKGIKGGKCYPEKYPLELFGSSIRLGGFDSVRNRDSETDEPIIFSYDAQSYLLNSTLSVELSFLAKEREPLNNGWLSGLVLRKEDGTILFSSKVENGLLRINEKDLSSLRDPFLGYLSFALGQMLLWNAEGETLSEKEFAPIKKYIDQCKSALGDYYDSFENTSHNIISRIGIDNQTNLIETILNQKTLFVMPALSELANVHKEDIIEKITDLSKRKRKGYGFKFEKEKALFRMKRIAKDFIKSEFDTFLDYFVDWEKRESLKFFVQKPCLLRHFDSSFPSLSDSIVYSYDLTDEYGIKIMDSFDNFKYPEWVNVIGKVQKEWRENKTYEPISFQMILETLFSFSISNLKTCESDMSFDKACPNRFILKSQRLFYSYFEKILEEIFQPAYFKSLEYVGSAAATVKRLYSFDADEGTLEGKIKRYVNLIREYTERFKDHNQPFEPGAFINKWIQEFGIGHSISFNQVAEGLGVTLHLHEDETDSKGHLLADEGYGITQLLSTLISIEIQIMSNKDVWQLYNEDVVVSTMFLEEPEVHLHPRYQSLLAEMFVDAYKIYNIHFIIETHSEYLIRKLQTYIPKGQVNEKEGLKPEEIALYYFYDPDPAKRPKNEPQIKKIGFRKDGSLDSAFGSGFFDEADNLAMSLLSGN